ncbi:MAG TPA: GTP cyclohydrolase II [Stellaceae bacterium]|nr:GTP cyclohydrolase II [Stellaceae bacterium]
MKQSAVRPLPEVAKSTAGNGAAINPLVARRVQRAIGDLRRGDFVVLRDGDSAMLLLAAESVEPEQLVEATRLGGGAPMLATTRRRAIALKLMLASEAAGGGAVKLILPASVGAAALRHLADPTATDERVEPAGISLQSGAPQSAALQSIDGHEALRLRITTVSADADAALVAAAVDLVKLARLLPSAVLFRLDAQAIDAMAGGTALIDVSVADVAAHQATSARGLREVTSADVPLIDAPNTRIIAFRPDDGGDDHLAILIGTPEAGRPVLTRLHSECFTGDLLGSLRCDCGDQLRGAIVEIAAAGSGVIIYLAQEGRGIGLVNKLRAYRLQDTGFDTLDANEQLGFDADERVYQPAAAILRALGFERIRLLTNNPEKLAALQRHGIDVVERVAHVFPSNAHNSEYLATKANRAGHLF